MVKNQEVVVIAQNSYCLIKHIVEWNSKQKTQNLKSLIRKNNILKVVSLKKKNLKSCNQKEQW